LDTAKGVAEGLDAVQNTAQGVSQAVRVGTDVVQNTVEGVADVTNKVAAGTADAIKIQKVLLM